MESLKSVDCGLLYRVQDLLRRKPNSYDVVFSVGSAKKAVRAVRILLEAASPALEKKFELWEDSVACDRTGEGIIPLPDIDAEAFEIFVKLTMLDDWTSLALTNLNLQPGQILNLISICRVYEIESGVKHLEDLMNTFYDNFAAFMTTPDFLRLSYTHLETILGSDNLPLKELDVFNGACRWGKSECERRGIEGTPKNLQLVLGDALYQIRFTLMTLKEFNQCMDTHNVLTEAEGFRVLRYITGNKNRRAQMDIAGFPFKTKPRAGLVQSTEKRDVKANPLTIVPKAVSVPSKVIAEGTPQFFSLDLTTVSKIVDNTQFICDGTEKWNCLATNRKILVHGLGFLGPIDGDASYDVTVTFKEIGSVPTDTIKKRIIAKKSNVFRIVFDQPITIKESSIGRFATTYYIYYSLKGPNTKSFQRTMGHWDSKRNGENEFELQWWSNQLAEILYTNV